MESVEIIMNLDDDICPTTLRENCSFCSGEACWLCGAGCWSNRRDCEHDVLDRHEGWNG